MRTSLHLAALTSLCAAACTFQPLDAVELCGANQDPDENDCVRLGDEDSTGGGGDPLPFGDTAAGDTALPPGDTAGSCPPGLVLINAVCTPECTAGNSLPCARGQCYLDATAAPTCDCPPQWTGPLCDECNTGSGYVPTNAGECVLGCGFAQDPCRNEIGGICIDGDGPQCACPDTPGCGTEADCSLTSCTCLPGFQDNEGDGQCLLDCLNAAPCPGTEQCNETSGQAVCECALGEGRDAAGVCRTGCTSDPECGANEVCMNSVCQCQPDTVRDAAGQCASTCATQVCNGSNQGCRDEFGWGGCGCVIYVDSANSAGTQSGTSWATAYTDLETALSAAAVLVSTTYPDCEVWVAAGTYEAALTLADTFAVSADVRMYGGFLAGAASTSERAPWDQRSVLTGLDPTGTDAEHVVSMIGPRSVVDGFEIQNGNSTTHGGGARIQAGATGARLSNCELHNNTAQEFGGAIIVDGADDVVLEDLSLFQNTSQSRGAAIHARNTDNLTVRGVAATNNGTPVYGGAIALSSSTDARLDAVVLVSNGASTGGSAIYTESSDFEMTNGFIIDNIGQGGAVAINGQSAEIVNTLFAANGVATQPGGALRATQTTVTLIQSSIVNNTARPGSAITLDDSDVTGRGVVISDNQSSSPDFAITRVMGASGSFHYENTYMRATQCEPGVCILSGPSINSTPSPGYSDPPRGNDEGDATLGAQFGATANENFFTTTFNLTANDPTTEPPPLEGRDVSGQFFRITGAPVEQIFLIVANGNSFVRVIGYPQTLPPNTFDFEIVDFRPLAPSPLTDAGYWDSRATLDLFRIPRADTLGIANTGGGAVNFADAGAFEVTTP